MINSFAPCASIRSYIRHPLFLVQSFMINSFAPCGSIRSRFRRIPLFFPLFFIVQGLNDQLMYPELHSAWPLIRCLTSSARRWVDLVSGAFNVQ